MCVCVCVCVCLSLSLSMCIGCMYLYQLLVPLLVIFGVITRIHPGKRQPSDTGTHPHILTSSHPLASAKGKIRLVKHGKDGWEMMERCAFVCSPASLLFSFTHLYPLKVASFLRALVFQLVTGNWPYSYSLSFSPFPLVTHAFLALLLFPLHSQMDFYLQSDDNLTQLKWLSELWSDGKEGCREKGKEREKSSYIHKSLWLRMTRGAILGSICVAADPVFLSFFLFRTQHSRLYTQQPADPNAFHELEL